MCTRATNGGGSDHSGNGKARKKSQSLFDFVLQQRQEFRRPTIAARAASSRTAWDVDDDSSDMVNIGHDGTNKSATTLDSHRSHLKRSMSRRGAIGFACAFTQSCAETASYFHDNPSDDSFVPMQRPPERSGSSATTRCRLGRQESSGSGSQNDCQSMMEDATDQFAAVAISDASDDVAPEGSMERSVRRKFVVEQDGDGNGSAHDVRYSEEPEEFDRDDTETSIDAAAHGSGSRLFQRQQAMFWDAEMQQSDSDDDGNDDSIDECDDNHDGSNSTTSMEDI